MLRITLKIRGDRDSRISQIIPAYVRCILMFGQLVLIATSKALMVLKAQFQKSSLGAKVATNWGLMRSGSKSIANIYSTPLGQVEQMVSSLFLMRR